MIDLQAMALNLNGTSYEIGHAAGTRVQANPALKAVHMRLEPPYVFESFDSKEAERAMGLMETWCPGINDELAGFADALGAPKEKMVYYAMTYLRPGCSQMALSESRTKCGRPLLIRNYDFNYKAEDFVLARTAVQGRYAHLGTCVLNFGRDDGINEKGLAVTMSSCGLPVGAMPGMRMPQIRGLQFWAVIRALLENCSDVGEALSYMKGMPIAYNLNLMVMDRHGDAALVETLDGKMAVEKMDASGCLMATNHTVIPPLSEIESSGMRNSMVRYRRMQSFSKEQERFSKSALKTFLLSTYPEGLCTHYYDAFLGTTKSMVLDPVEGTLEICWGGYAGNGWHKYDVKRPIEEGPRAMKIAPARAPEGFFEWIERASLD